MACPSEQLAGDFTPLCGQQAEAMPRTSVPSHACSGSGPSPCVSQEGKQR